MLSFTLRGHIIIMNIVNYTNELYIMQHEIVIFHILKLYCARCISIIVVGKSATPAGTARTEDCGLSAARGAAEVVPTEGTESK